MLKETIKEEVNRAMKEGNETVCSVLRMLLAAIVSREKEKRYKLSKEKPELDEERLVKESQITDEGVIEVVSTEIKKRKDAVVLYEKGGRKELADKEKKEIEILMKYLPEQLSAEEVKKIVEEAMGKTGAKEIKDMGRVMAEVMAKVKGKADSGEVGKLVKDILTSK
ncbi:MAG: GatB/YqeY domain-containing protein [Candidatus Staskawiczbacteria bacterium]|jgi:hypothetical protein